MDEVLNHRLGNFLAHKLGHQVEVVVVADDDGRLLVALGFLGNRSGKGLVHRDVSGLPGIMNAGVHVGIVGRIPHVVL